ncbi:rhodanese-like domain-containing protein [Methylacidimicrobium sp. B4]|uniref:rhodanese-like domain-containing protein n=1 Tax=Methylacidimicrobium sp. B4 TaxID=2796139 RepID=UPI001A8E66FC|nr:rhodanese-like domain-containing protein [Methylacidimicrobium sp. B4]QSR84941.1 rhodanese-like domain-containing protein [Methylacidimicrobium sp. B4]
MISSLLPSFRLALGFLLLLALWGAVPLRGEEPSIPIAPGDPWTRSDILLPKDFLALQKPGSPSYRIFQVGFPFLYKAGHIHGAIYIGAGKDPEGIQALKDALSSLPKDQKILLYCGCCPLDVCPNIRPAFQAAKELGFSDAKVLYLPHDFVQDWTHKGYPTEKGW